MYCSKLLKFGGLVYANHFLLTAWFYIFIISTFVGISEIRIFTNFYHWDAISFKLIYPIFRRKYKAIFYNKSPQKWEGLIFYSYYKIFILGMPWDAAIICHDGAHNEYRSFSTLSFCLLLSSISLCFTCWATSLFSTTLCSEILSLASLSSYAA